MTSQIVNLASREVINQSLEVSEYVTGQMSESERLAFEEKLVDNHALQQALAQELQLRNLIVAEQVEQPVSEQAFNEFAQQLKRQTYFTFQSVKIAGTIAATILVALVAYVWFPEPPSAQFETLTNSTPVMQNRNSDLYTVVFKKNMSPDSRMALAKSLGLTLVDGPGAANSFTVQSAERLNSEQITRLQNHPQIVLFEPLATHPQ